MKRIDRRQLLRLGFGAAAAGRWTPAVFGQRPAPETAQGWVETAPPDQPPRQPTDTVYVCPMDPDVRSTQPGKCPRCGMTLVAGIPDYSSEYRMNLKLTPDNPKPGQPVRLDFAVFDPWKNRPVRSFQIVHEKLFHMFLVSQDLQFFLHDHPVPNPDGTFSFNFTFPKPGMYRLLADLYPLGGTPQLIPKTIFVPGAAVAFSPVKLAPDYAPKDTENMHVEIALNPTQPLAGQKEFLHYTVSPTDGFEQYLGAWAHMLIVSDDLVDLIHTHPTVADGGSDLQFNLIFPRNRTYRIWTQFQRKGIVNTSRFDVPVRSLDDL